MTDSTAARSLAEHEAAHAVMRYLYGRSTPGCVRRFEYVTVVADEHALGHVMGVMASWADTETTEDLRFTPYEHHNASVRRRIEHDIMVFFAGAVWDEMNGRFDHDETVDVHGESIYVGRAHHDVTVARMMAELFRGSDDTITAYQEWLWYRTQDFLSEWDSRIAVAALADALLERETLKYRDATAVIHQSMQAALLGDGDAQNG